MKSQQFYAVMAENGVLRVDDDSQAALARDMPQPHPSLNSQDDRAHGAVIV
ncbi:hypothetical protein GCM10027259_37980 [Micromonospora palomenae]|uniref:hypothetical protein n=1 Tax=Micromonospora palomenae TaxID=1461247 RepID=UPI0014796901|nr:hypothetical protein [Micromonospora palomenae]